MPNNPRRVTPTIPVTPVSTVTIKTTDVPQLYNKVQSTSEALLKSRLGIPAGQPLPTVIKQLLDKEIKASLSTNISDLAKTDVGMAVKTSLKEPAFKMFDDRIKTALGSAQHIGQSNDVAAILKQKSDLLFQKREAYVTAGFTKTEANEILIAEIAGKHGS